MAENRKRPSKTHWVTRDNKRVEVRQMSTDHIENTVAMLLRVAKHAKASSLETTAWIASLFDDVDWYMDAVHDEIHALTLRQYASQMCPTFDTLEKELAKRQGLAYESPNVEAHRLSTEEQF